MNYWRQWIYNIREKLNVFTSKDLGADEAIHTQISGLGLSGGSINLKNNLILTIKGYCLAKFVYNESDIDTDLVEDFIFQFGRVAIGKLDNRYIVGSFLSKSYDINGNVKKFTIQTKNRINTKEGVKGIQGVFEVGKDGIILYGTPSWWVKAKLQFGLFFRLQTLLDDLVETYNSIKQNILLGRSYLNVPSNVSDDYLKKLIKQMLSNSPAIRARQNTKGQTELNPNLDKTELFNFNERTNELWDNYNNQWEIILTLIGCDTNSTKQKKERQITDEIAVNNSFSKGYEAFELKQREKMCKEIKDAFNLDLTVRLRTEIEEEKQENELKENLNKELKDENNKQIK